MDSATVESRVARERAVDDAYIVLVVIDPAAMLTCRVAIEGAARVWPKLNNKITPGKLKATIGPRISSAKFDETTVNEFAAVVQSEVERMLGHQNQPV